MVERVAETAEKRGVSCTQIALAWLLQRQPVTAPKGQKASESRGSSGIRAYKAAWGLILGWRTQVLESSANPQPAGIIHPPKLRARDRNPS